MKIDLDIEFEDDKKLIWRQGAADAAGTSYRLIITRLQLFVPRLIFNSEGQKLYMENYLKPYKWTYLKESVFTSNISTQNSGHFRITNGIPKPRHVFVFFINKQTLTTNFKIHSCIILSLYQPIQEHQQDVILNLEMEMNSQDLNTNQQKILQECFEMC